MGKPSAGFCRSLLYMKQILSSALIAVVAAAPASAQSRLTLPPNLFAVGQAVAGQAPAVPLPVRTSDSNGPRVSLTLEDAVKRALENNLDIAVERIGQQIFDVDIASIRSVYSPVVSSLLSNQSSKNASTSTISGGQTGSTINNSTFVFNGGVLQDVPWGGGSFSATLDNRRTETSNLTATINPQYTPTWSAQYSQPLLRDFKIDSTRQQLLITRINQSISDIQLQQTTMNTVANVRNAYWDYVFAVQSVDVSRQSLLLAEELLRNNQTKVEIGTMAPIDVVQAQSQAAQQRQVVVTAEGTRRTAEIALKRLIVSGTADPLWTSTIEPVDRPDFRPEPIDVSAATQRALATRTDVLQARKSLEANDATLRLLNNQKLPQVDLVTRYATTGIGGTRLITQGTGVDRGEIVGVDPGGYLDALSTLFRNRLPTWSVALNMSYNLGTSTADASIARARIQQNQIDVQLRQIDLQVTSDVSNAAILVQNAAERVQAAQASRDLAQQQLDAENSKFGVGMSTNYLVVLAQRDLADAQNLELQAVLAYRKAVVDFERVQQTGNAGNVTLISR
jgi:outer membrane protein